MKAVSKTITYILDNVNEIEEEIQKQYDEGWRVFKKRGCK